MTNQKLELTWLGKGEQPRLEPRLLLLEPEHCHGDPNAENILIHGDNLLALKALEQQYAGKVKCIYIDPPYNTGNAFEHYDDGIEHSIWLNLMHQRLIILRNLLREDGSIFISIDNNELPYLQVIMDEVFGRKNRKNLITIKRGSVTGAKVINPGLVNISEFIIVYSKKSEKWNPNRLVRKKDRDARYGTFIENFEDDYSTWRYIPLLDAFSKSIGIEKKNLKKAVGEKLITLIDEFVIKNSMRVVQPATLDENSVSQEATKVKHESIKNPNQTFLVEREGKKPYYIVNGKLILFVKDRLAVIDGELNFSEPLTDIWDDVLPNDLHNEGGVEFRKGKKPEKLIQRVIELVTNSGDLVLDSFLGSGTTAAVAHKMNRRWIGIELGEHCYTHCVPRLRKVVSGEDQGGISKAMDWKGGGGFKTYRLAPSLLAADEHAMLRFNPDFTDDMVAEAVAKIEGFTYAPDPEVFWKQSRSSEQDYLLVTKIFVTAEWLAQLHEQMAEEESLLLCCPAYGDGCERAFSNITLKKIPNAFMRKYEFGKDDYSLNVQNVIGGSEDVEFLEDDFDDAATPDSKPRNKKGRVDDQPTLF